jgi:hypothetical protein
MRFSAKHGRVALGALAVVAAIAVAAKSGLAQSDNPAEANHYPYDPVCAWGRIANGKGMLVRCITQNEANALLSNNVPAASASSAAPVPSASAAAPDQNARIDARVVRVTPDQGDLPKAVRKLQVARKRFVDCVHDNGGLHDANGEVEVRFLVRGRGRAEGVSVRRNQGVSRKAAECVAGVVDRRYVGVPQAPFVGATAVIKFSKLGP